MPELHFLEFQRKGERLLKRGLSTIPIGGNAAASIASSIATLAFADPTSDIVAFTNRFDTLPDGAKYLTQIVVNAQSKQLQMTTTNSNYTPVGQ